MFSDSKFLDWDGMFFCFSSGLYGSVSAGFFWHLEPRFIQLKDDSPSKFGVLNLKKIDIKCFIK
jgi:hypothetical protein